MGTYPLLLYVLYWAVVLGGVAPTSGVLGCAPSVASATKNTGGSPQPRAGSQLLLRTRYRADAQAEKRYHGAFLQRPARPAVQCAPVFQCSNAPMLQCASGRGVLAGGPLPCRANEPSPAHHQPTTYYSLQARWNQRQGCAGMREDGVEKENGVNEEGGVRA